jgi:hypothetical protein
MVSNLDYSLATDLLAQIDLPLDKPIKKINDLQAKALLDITDPSAKRRFSSYFTAMARQWWLNGLYYMGFQSLEPPEILENVDPGLLLQDSGYIANHLVRIIQGNVARKAQARPDWEVLPQTPDQPDQDGAKVGTALLNHFWLDKRMERINVRLNLWLEICGTAFYYTGWDKTAGAQRRVYLNPTSEKPSPLDARSLQPDQKAFLEQNGYATDVAEGDYDFDLLSPYQVTLVPRYESLDKQPWVRIDRIVPLAEIWNRFPKMAAQLMQEDMGPIQGLDYWMRLATITSRPADARLRDSMWNDGVRLRELWIPPSARCPNGLTVIGAGKKLMLNSQHLFAKEGCDIKFPLADFHNIRVPGRFHSMSTIEHLLGPQRDYNRGRHQLNLQRDYYGNPQWMAPKGSLTNKPIRNDFGDVWEYDRTKGAPTLLSPPPVAPATVESIMQAISDMQMIAAQSDPTQGKAPAGVRSGVALQSLQERDQLVIGPSIADLESGYELAGSNMLKLAHAFMKMPRCIAIYGETRQADLVWFRGLDLNGNTHVRVKAGSMMPKSRAETMQRILDMVQLGALNPAMNPQDRRIVMKAMEVGGFDKMFLEEDLDRRRANHENMMFSRPSPDPMFAYPGVDVDDDHAAHLEEHLKFKKTDEFERLPPLRKQLLNAHMMEHKMAMADAMQAQFAMQQATQGPGGGGQEGSQPRELGKPSAPAKSNQPQKAQIAS